MSLHDASDLSALISAKYVLRARSHRATGDKSSFQAWESHGTERPGGNLLNTTFVE